MYLTFILSVLDEGYSRNVPCALHLIFTFSPLVFSGVRIAHSLVFCVMFCRSLFVLFILVIVLSILRFTDSGYPFSISKVFFKKTS